MEPHEHGTGHEVPIIDNVTAQGAGVKEKERTFQDNRGDARPVHEDLLDMVKILSHDIRSPLVTITAALRLLKKGAYGQVNGVVSDELENLSNIVIQTIGTLEDFLGKALSISCDLDSPRERLLLKRDVVEPVMDEFSGDFKKNGTIIEYRLSSISFGDFPIQGNLFLLRSVFRNLIKNALNHGKRDCKIIIGLKDQGSIIGIDVFNSGRPIPPELREMLFQKFNKMKKGTCGVPEGMGMGLYLVKEILQSHGGNIRYEAETEGSHFIFTLPCMGKIESLPGGSCG